MLRGDHPVAAAGEKYDLGWLHELGLPYIQYQSSDPKKPHYFVDNANEGGAYLQVIHDYYDCLPEVLVSLVAELPGTQGYTSLTTSYKSLKGMQ